MRDSSGQKHTGKIGVKGENLATRFLEEKGYEILQRNFRLRGGEIDIVARDGDVLVFVEVKTGRTQTFGPPETWVTRRKQEKIGQMAAVYLQQHEIVDQDCRFDVVAITFVDEQPKINHIENAFWL